MWFTPSFPSFLSLVLQQHFAQTATSSKGTEQGSNSLRLTARTLRWHHKQLRLIWASESHKESDINLSALILTQRGQKNTSYIYAAQVQAKKHHTWWTKKKKYIYNETDHDCTKTNRNNGPVRTGTEGWRLLQMLEKQFLWIFMSFMVKFDSKGLEKETKCFIFYPYFNGSLRVKALYAIYLLFSHLPTKLSITWPSKRISSSFMV